MNLQTSMYAGHFLCLLIGLTMKSGRGQSVPVRLARQDDPASTDYTGQIRSFSEFGAGLNTTPPALICYTDGDYNVVFITPRGTILERNGKRTPGRPALGSFLYTSAWTGNAIPNGDAIILHRGPDYFSPDGEYCCRFVYRASIGIRCLTLTSCPALTPITTGVIRYDVASNQATYTCDPGYTVVGTSPITCNPGTPGTWSAPQPTCQLISCGLPTLVSNGNMSFTGITLKQTATYYCDQGYRMSGSNTVTCQQDGEWSTPPNCQLICPDLPPLANGGIIYSDGTLPRAEGSTATYGCDNGHSLSAVINRTCTGSGWTAEGAPTCIATCPDLTLVNGTVTNNPPSSPRLEGTMATHSCNLGYQLSSSGTNRTCQADRSWSGSPKLCNPVSCGDYPNIVNGYLTEFTGTTFTNRAFYRCNTGYELSGLAGVTCQANGKWSTLPSCQLICSDLTPPANGVITYNATGTPRPIDTTATYSCDSGYWLPGNKIRRCTHSGWSGSVPSCKAICPDLMLTNGMIVYGSTLRLEGTMAFLWCSSGYHSSSGESTTMVRTCQSDRTWSGSNMACNPVSCDGPPNVVNGTIVSVSGTTIGSIAIYSCNAGYQLSGLAIVNCQASGKWTIPPKCTALCSKLPSLKNGVIHYMNTNNEMIPDSSVYPEGTVAHYSCDKDRHTMLIGESIRTCQSDTNWSFNPPYCADQVLLQLKYGPTDYCLYWTESKVSLMRAAMRRAVQEAILTEGNYTLPLEYISEGVFSCYNNQDHTTYRTTITGTNELSAEEAVNYVTKWVESGAATQVQWYIVYFDNSCQAHISSLEARECTGKE